MRAFLRVLGAILAGYAAAAIVVGIGRIATNAAFGLATGSPPTTRYLMTNVVISLLGAVLGGYLCMWLTPTGRSLVALAGLVAVFMIVGAAYGRAAWDASQPPWYLAIVTLLGVLGVLTGAAARQAGRRL